MISKEQVIKIAALARMNLSEKETEKMSKDLESILNYIDQLNRADISGSDLSEEKIHSNSSLREDCAVSQSEKTIELMLNQAPQKEEGYIKVKEILT